MQPKLSKFKWLKIKKSKGGELGLRPRGRAKWVMSPDLSAAPEFTPAAHLDGPSGALLPRRPVHGDYHRCATAVDLLMILPQVHLQKPCYDFYLGQK